VLYLELWFWNLGSRPHMRMVSAWVATSPDRRQIRTFAGALPRARSAVKR